MHVFILVKWCLQIKIIEVGTHVTHPRYGHCAVPQQFGRYEAHHTSGNISRVINGVATHSDSEMIRVDFWGELATHNHCIYDSTVCGYVLHFSRNIYLLYLFPVLYHIPATMIPKTCTHPVALMCCVLGMGFYD